MVLDEEFKQTLRDMAINAVTEKQKQVHDYMNKYVGNKSVMADLAHKYNEIDKFMSYISNYK